MFPTVSWRAAGTSIRKKKRRLPFRQPRRFRMAKPFIWMLEQRWKHSFLCWPERRSGRLPIPFRHAVRLMELGVPVSVTGGELKFDHQCAGGGRNTRISGQVPIFQRIFWDQCRHRRRRTADTGCTGSECKEKSAGENAGSLCACRFFQV